MESQRQSGFDVFLSYSRRDEARVAAVQEALEREGLRVWRDKPEIQAGESFISEIEAGLSQSRCVVLFVSQDALGSTWVLREWNVALTLPMRIIPVRLDDSELPLMLRPVEAVDLRDPGLLEAAAKRIADGVGRQAVALPAAPQSSSNPSVLGQDVIVLARMIVDGHRAGQRLETARLSAAVVGVAAAAGVLALGNEAWVWWTVIAAAGSVLIAAALVWTITAQLALNRSEIKRLNGIKDGIELYCPNQPACAGFRTRLETILKKAAGIEEAAC